MHDKIIDKDEVENLKRKKIRRILLIRTDEELKKMLKRKSKIMINSRTSEEINKSYDLYNILLSEKTKVYGNFIRTEEKIFPIINNNNKSNNYNNIKKIHPKRLISKTKMIEMPIKTLDTTFDDELSPRSPILNFFPTKIDLGHKKFNIPKRKSEKIVILEGFFNPNDKTILIENQLNSNVNQNVKILNSNEKHLNSNGKTIDSKGKTIDSNGNTLTYNANKMNKSTRVQKKRLYKLVDKIMYIKMNEYTEKKVKKNIIRLRKYCNKLKIPKVEPKKHNKLKILSEQHDKKVKEKKRMTLTDGKNFFKKSLFGSIDKKSNHKKRMQKPRLKSSKYVIEKKNEIYSNDLKDKKREEEEDEGEIINKIISSKQFTKYISIRREQKLDSPNKKRKLKRMKTLNGNFKTQRIESNIKKKIKFTKDSEKIKNWGDLTTKHLNKKDNIISKRNNISTKFDIATKNNNRKKTLVELNKKEKKENIQTFFNNKEKKEKFKNSNQKDKKSKKQIYNKCLHYSKKDESIELFNFDKKWNNIKKGLNIVSIKK